MTDESLAAALEREHREIDAGVQGLADGSADGTAQLEAAIAALRRHIYLEEEFLFPALPRQEPPAPILVMLREHGRLWRALDELAALLRVGAEPAGLRERCHRLAVALLHHNVREERTVYPLADRLPAPAAARLRELLASGQLPDGWTCIRAR